MTRNKTLLVLGLTVASMAGCSRGESKTAAAPAAAAQAVAAQATAPANAADIADTAAAQAAMSNALRSAIAMHAQASIPALACGVETQANLDASKSEVRKLAHAEGIDDAIFDQAYAAGERKSRTRWEAAPATKRASACEQWKTMTEQAQAYAKTHAQTP